MEVGVVLVTKTSLICSCDVNVSGDFTFQNSYEKYCLPTTYTTVRFEKKNHMPSI
jgi:hypothetical protein